ncbi:unnamed protein product [Cuscuta campestris]|uniref:Retrotransposon Copia-like N-terminal domain-containing protein n=1 Tax=Cuscuta campestris TaxID=132261 RepID=A0A484KJP3_9ASTE|nr:unnamed protein product [Cuscuta campestris]
MEPALKWAGNPNILVAIKAFGLKSHYLGSLEKIHLEEGESSKAKSEKQEEEVKESENNKDEHVANELPPEWRTSRHHPLDNVIGEISKGTKGFEFLSTESDSETAFWRIKRATVMRVKIDTEEEREEAGPSHSRVASRSKKVTLPMLFESLQSLQSSFDHTQLQQATYGYNLNKMLVKNGEQWETPSMEALVPYMPRSSSSHAAPSDDDGDEDNEDDEEVHTTIVGLDLLGYVDGSVHAPSPFSDAAHKQPNPAYTCWYRQDAILLSTLLGSCTDAVQPVISLAETSADAWSRLAVSLANMSRGRIISLKSKLANNPRRNRTIEAFIADMTTITSDLALAGSPVTDEDLAGHIMSQLGDDYSSVYQSLRGRNDDISLDELSTILKDCEREIHDRSAASSDLVPTANHAQRMHGSDHRGGTFGCGSQSGASRSGMRGRGSSNPTRGGRYCQFCDYPGHDTKFCRKLQRFLKEHNVSIGSALLATPTTHMIVSLGGVGMGMVRAVCGGMMGMVLEEFGGRGIERVLGFVCAGVRDKKEVVIEEYWGMGVEVILGTNWAVVVEGNGMELSGF